MILKYMDEIVASKVSVRARERGQFLHMYARYGKDLPEEWALKRTNFIKRTLAAYKLKPSRRRLLALICWAYHP
jgi:hypothetical protein